MAGHGSPPPENRADHPARKVGRESGPKRELFTPQWQQRTQPAPEPPPWKQRLKRLGRD